MKRRWMAGILAAALLVFMPGCQKEPKHSAEADETFSVIEKMRMQVKDEGIFYIDGYSSQMKFYDFNLAEAVPLCDRPNCEHNTAECSAYFPQGYMSGMGCYQGSLYYYDNMAPELPVYQCDKNGSNRKLLTKLNEDEKYSNLSVMLPAFFAEDEMIFGLQYSQLLTKPIEKEDGTLVDQENFWMLGKLNLKDGSFEIVKEAKAYDGYTQIIEISDYAAGNIFYYIGEGTEREQHMYNLETQTDELLFEESGAPVNFAGSVRNMGREVYICNDGQTLRIYTLDVKTKETKVVAEKKIEKGKALFEIMAGDALAYCVFDESASAEEAEEFGAIDLETGEDRALTKEQYQYAPTIAATENWYVGTGEKGTFCIPKSAYEAGDWSKAQVIGSF